MEYLTRENVKAAVEKALALISQKQDHSGGFFGWGANTSESCAQIIVALCELGISSDDIRFVKNGNTVVDNLLSYYTDEGGFKHTYDNGKANLMATEQGLCALAAVMRYNNRFSGVYSMNDVQINEEIKDNNSHVKQTDIIYPGKTFSDIVSHANKTAIEALAERNIINGKSGDLFEPDATMTRAEFATIITRGLGLDTVEGQVFTDVQPEEWFFDYINAAHSYGIVMGVSNAEFNPYGTITREEACVMISRAAKLCDIYTHYDTSQARDILAGFTDYVKISDWAFSSIAFCCNREILLSDVIEIMPQDAVTRGEIAQMLFNMLTYADLL